MRGRADCDGQESAAIKARDLAFSQEALVAAQRLSEATGLSVQELIEIALFGIRPEELRLVKPPGAMPVKATSRAPRARRPLAQVTPIARARARRTATPPESQQQPSHIAERAD